MRVDGGDNSVAARQCQCLFDIPSILAASSEQLEQNQIVYIDSPEIC